MKRYKRYLQEDIYYNEDDPDYEYLFKAQSQGGRAWIKIYQTPTDKKFGGYSKSEDGGGGGGKDLDDADQEILSWLISTLVNEHGVIKKIDLDKLAITKTWLYFLNKLKDYKYLEKMPSGSEQRKFYYSIIWSASDGLRTSPKISNTKFMVWFDKFFDKVNNVIKEKGWNK